MAANHLEQLIAEWYEYQGYFVRRNILVGKRAKGGYECELDVVAFHPERQHLVHIAREKVAWSLFLTLPNRSRLRRLEQRTSRTGEQ